MRFYAKADEHVVIFIDSNGKIIKAGENLAQYLAENAVVTVPTAPTKPKSSFLGWSLLGSTAAPTLTIPNASGHAVYLATYEAETGAETQANITVEGGISDATNDVAAINTVVQLMHDDELGTFSYWVDENNQILSKNDEYSFTALGKNRTFRAVFNDEKAISTPIINLVDYPDLRGGEYVSYVGQYELVEGYELVEFGIVYEKEGADVYAKATNYNHETNEFLMSFVSAGKSNFRAYLKYVDANGFVFTEYNTGLATQYADDLIISEYVEGTSSNRYIEIYNGTGSTAQIYILSLTGSLEDGQVVVIAHTNATLYTGQIVKTNSNVMTFNGDDSVFLTRNDDTIVDYVGIRAQDFGSNKTLVRKSTVSIGVSEWNLTEWDDHPVDTVTYLGSHTMTFGSTSPKYDSSKVDQAVLGLPLFEGSYSAETTVVLPKHNENGALITWAFQDLADSNNSYMNLETGVITVPETGAKTVKIKATVNVGATQVEKLYEFSVLGRLTIDEVRSKADGTTVKFIGIVTGFYGTHAFIEDESGAIQLRYNTALDSNIAVGNQLIIEGTVSTSSGMKEISSITATTLVGNGHTLSTPVDLEGILDITEDYQARRINLTGLTVKEKTAATLTLTDGTNELKVVATATDVKDKFESASINEPVIIHGMHVDWDTAGKKLRALHVDEFELLGMDSYYVQEALDSISLPETTTTDLTLPTTHTNGSSISWTSDKPTVISNTGVVNRQAQDETVTLIATATKGTATLTKEFTVTVTKEGSILLPIEITLTESTIWERAMTSYAAGNFEKEFSGMRIKANDDGIYTGNSYNDNKIQVKKNYGWIHNTTIPEGYIIKSVSVNGQTSGRVNIYFSTTDVKPNANGVLGVTTSGDVSSNRYKYFYIKENNTQSGTVTIDSIIIKLIPNP